MIPTANPKTITRRELMKQKYGDIDNINYNIVVYPSQIDLAGYHYKTGNLIVTTYEQEIDSLYCYNPELLYKNSKNNAEHITCLNIFWTCDKCTNCDKRRRLKVLKQIDKRFRYHTDIKEFHKISFALIDDDTPSKIAKRLKYINGKNNLLMWIIPNSHQEKIMFVCEGKGTNPLSKEDILNLVSVKDKYRFLGKWYNKVPDVEFAGMTREEIKELSKVKAAPKERCDCGTLESDHTLRKIHSKSDFDKYVEAEEFYEEEHIKFKKKYIN